MKRLLITGASGFLGSRIAEFYKGKYEIDTPTHREMDITDEESVACRIAGLRPDIIVHCAAVSDTGRCEREPETSWKINVEGSVNIAKAARQNQATGLICSSDQVYFGSSLDGPHSEYEEITPCHLYGRQKHEAEEACLTVNSDCVLLRLSWMYDIRTVNSGEHSDFLRTFLAKLDSPELLRFPVHDVRGISDVNVVIKNLEKVFELEGGIYNFGSPNEKNVYETMFGIFKKFGWDINRLQKDDKAFLQNPRNISMRQEKINSKNIVFPETADSLADNISQALAMKRKEE